MVGSGGGPNERVGIGRGLKLWVSNISDLSHFYEYLPPNTTFNARYHDNNACVICPSKVRQDPSNPPIGTQIAFLGDSYTWSEPEWYVPSSNRTYYVLSGSGRCPQTAGTPPTYCGWGGDVPGKAQALLFSSKNLVDFRFVSTFYDNSRADDVLPPDAGQGHAIMTPDTFTFPTGEQAFIYLGQKNTRWVTGTATRENGELSKFVEKGFRGNPTTDWVDQGGGTHCGQSFWDPHGRRIQFMWLMIDLPNSTWQGSPSLPREIVLAPAGSVTGLLFRPLPEMHRLHVNQAPTNTSLALSGPAADWQEIAVADGLHCHIVITLVIPDFSTVVSVELRGADGAGSEPNALGSTTLTVGRGRIQLEHTSAPGRPSFPATLRYKTRR